MIKPAITCVIGGDGSLKALLDHIVRLDAPLVLIPAGTESLAARHFGTTLDLDKTLDFNTATISQHHYGRLNCDAIGLTESFFSMISLGPDAAVVRRVAEHRSGPISKITYVWHAALTAPTYHIPEFSLEVDGVQELSHVRGQLVIANCPEYALGINPVPKADSRSELLNAAFFSNYGLGLLRNAGWYAKAGLHLPQNHSDAITFEGKRMTLTIHDKKPILQADGDFVNGIPSNAPIMIEKSRGTFSVLGRR